jgi:hypothetical protein
MVFHRIDPIILFLVPVQNTPPKEILNRGENQENLYQRKRFINRDPNVTARKDRAIVSICNQV